MESSVPIDVRSSYSVGKSACSIRRLVRKERAVKPEVYPFPIPEGFAGRAEYLRHLAFEGAKRRWGDPLPDKVVERLEFELCTLAALDGHGLDASSYFLVVSDYVEAARRMGVTVGPGRGGAGGSALAYALGITDIDPLEYGLLFERFLNPERICMPDIDIDFDEDGLEKVFDYIVGKYGRDHVAAIAAFGMEGPRATELCGCVRRVFFHACGVVISARKLADVLPVTDHGGLPVMQYDGRCMEEAGLVKFDLLGLKALTDQKRCIELVKARTGETIDFSRIPDDDKEALAIFARGDTGGIFQFDGEGIRDFLRQLRPTRFSDLVAANALFRPGLLGRLAQFIRRKNGEEPAVCDHPLMGDVLAETYGMAIYQEQVMLLAQRLGGFTRGESDTLRKALGKKQQQVIDRFRVKFVGSCLANSEFRGGEWRDERAARALAEKTFRDWEEFALCAFNKSHAACHALLAYRSAYLKAHWPEDYAGLS